MKKLLIGGAALALAVPALAQVAPTPAPQMQHAMKVQTRAEVQAKVAEHFARVDTNRDGAITRAEWDAAQAQRQQRVAARDQNGDGRPDAKRFGHRGMMGGFGGRMFEMADTNHDGRVSLQEAQAAALQHFDMVDSNRDGRITPEERMQMHQKMRAERQHG